MSEIFRREILSGGVAIVSAGLAGCSSSGNGGSGDGGVEPNPWTEVLDDRITLNEDGYQTWSWDIDESTEISWEMTVRSGPDIDFFVMESTEFDEYQANNRFKTYVDGYGVSDSGNGVLPEGNYRFVLDNTTAGNVEPPTNFDDDVADVELRVEARSA
ncbi:hypothetical protein [Halorubrum sp. Hd13]|uniref:hypothetical protein n=1 Tax=Halorubrum sp. Hd13 TaxID=1480728 RepID=UPI001140718B|nr:hypothetical protein [Halorubrum sp. Hd13]